MRFVFCLLSFFIFSNAFATTVNLGGTPDPVTTGVANSVPQPGSATPTPPPVDNNQGWFSKMIKQVTDYVTSAVTDSWYYWLSTTFTFSKELIVKYLANNRYWVSFINTMSGLPPVLKWALCLLDLQALVLITLGAHLTRFILRVLPIPMNPWAH